MIALLLLMGCGPETTSNSIEGLVECRGMTHNSSLFRFVRSPFLSYDPATDYTTPRCELGLTADLTGADIAMGIGESSDLTQGTDRGTGYVYADGTRWNILSGTLAFDQFDDTLAKGSYDFEVGAVDVDNQLTGKTATIEGPFSWCEGDRDDCPFRFESTLAGSATITSPALNPHDGGVTGCRMLVEPSTGALQVDLQLGTWRGDNVGQIWVAECGVYGLVPPQNNLFRFQAGGVTGPGSYGPQYTADFDGTLLPSLDWEHPAAWADGINQDQACGLFYTNVSNARTQLGSECSFDVDATNERFELTCSNVLHDGPGGWPGDIGSFSIATDCTYEER